MTRLILVVEDEPPIREMITFGLRRAGFEVCEAGDGHTARLLLTERSPDLVLMDWMLPDLSGLELTRLIRREAATSHLPVIMLTARASESDKAFALDSGADDFVSKPFSPRELLARVNALLRWTPGSTHEETLELGGLVMHRASHRVTAAGLEISLVPTEYRMLEFFMQNPERVYARAQLLDRIWGANTYVEERTIDVHIRRLRKALETARLDGLIQTVRSAGYRFSTRTNDVA